MATPEVQRLQRQILKDLDERLGIDLSVDKPQRSKIVRNPAGNEIQISAMTVKEQNQLINEARRRNL